MAFTPEDRRKAIAAVDAGTATRDQQRKVAEMTRTGDPSRGSNAEARKAIGGK